MHKHPFHRQTWALLAGLACMLVSPWASADPPGRVARLGLASGAVSFSPAGEEDWVQASVNRPLTNGDRLWVDGGARAEVQLAGTTLRLGADSSVVLLNLDDRMAQWQLAQGSLLLRIRSLVPGQVFEIDTPQLAFTLRQVGDYRIDVDPQGAATLVQVRKGRGEVYGEGAAYSVDAGRSYRFQGTGLRDYQELALAPADALDRWAAGRDRSYANSVSARYVSSDVVGYQDLDANGSWRVDPRYGNVWTPRRMPAGWVPYRDGHWSWIDPWGWTWVDDAPWGYAVSHYGRWANMGGAWGWVPGGRTVPAVYAPALVAFVGGQNFQVAITGGNVGAVGWFPLAPREAYQPSYLASPAYRERINRSVGVGERRGDRNTVINNTVVNTTTNITQVNQIVYANRSVPGAVVAVPAAAFAQSLPVAKTAVRVLPAALAVAAVGAVAAVAPTAQSVHGAAPHSDKPSGRAFERPVIARTAPPAAHAGFAAQQAQLATAPLPPPVAKPRPAPAPAPADTSPAPAKAEAPPMPAKLAPPAPPPAPRERVEPPARPVAKPAATSPLPQPAAPVSAAPVKPAKAAVPPVAQPAAPSAHAEPPGQKRGPPAGTPRDDKPAREDPNADETERKKKP